MNDYSNEILKNKDLLNNLIDNCVRDKETGEIENYRTVALGHIVQFLALRATKRHEEFCGVRVIFEDDREIIRIEYDKDIDHAFEDVNE